MLYNVFEIAGVETEILHHICGVHQWVEDGQEYRCLHDNLSEQDQTKKKWLVKGSAAYNILKNLVMDKSLLKNMSDMTLFKHSGNYITLRYSKMKETLYIRAFRSTLVVI